MTRRWFWTIGFWLALAADSALGAATAPATAREDVTVAFSAKGVEFRCGAAAPLTLEYPALVTKTGAHDIAGRNVENGKAVVKYAGGAELTVRNDDGVLTYQFAGLPDDVTSFRFEMGIPLTFNTGGSWQIGSASGKFPAPAANPPFLFKGDADSFRLIDPAGNALPLKLPGTPFQQLQDNRQWNTSAFGWKWFTPQSDRLTVIVYTKAKEAALKAEEERRQQLWVKDQSGKVVSVDFSRQLKGPDEIAAYFNKPSVKNRILIGGDVAAGPDRALLLKTGADYIRLGWGFMVQAERDLKEVRELEAKGVHVVLGLGSHYPPGGFTQFKDTYFVDNFGHTGEGQSSRVVYGGQDWPQYSRASQKFRTELEKEFAPFLRTTMERANHNLVAVRVDNEPGYFWLQDRTYDFHPDAIAMCKDWLAGRYQTIAALNDAYGTAYASFDQVEIPRDLPPVKNLAAWLDQRRANVHIIRDFLQWEKTLVRREAPGLPVTFNAPGALDWWHLWRLHDLYHCAFDLDIVGIDIYQDQYGHRFMPGYCMDTGIGIAAGRDVHVLEHSVYDPGHLPPAPLNQRLDMYRSLVWTLIGHGARGLLAWGDALGEPERVRMMAETVQTVKQRGLGLYRPAPRRIAVVADADSLFYHGGMGDKSPVWIQQSFLGWHAALRRNHYEADVLFADQVREGIPAPYHTLVLAVPILMDQALADRLKAFVAGGGLLVAEARFAELDRHGKPVTGAPGFGLGAVFGVKTGNTSATPATIALSEGKITGKRYSTPTEANGATVLARTADGAPGITSHACGKGTAVFIATSVGDRLLDDNGNDALASLLARLIRERHPEASPYRTAYEGTPFVDATMLKQEDDRLFVLTIQPQNGKPIVPASETVLYVKQELAGAATTAYLALPETGQVSARGMEFHQVPMTLDAEKGEYAVRVGKVSSAALVHLTREPRP